ncbi:MAG: class I SAM-dependent methyltransferase [Phycisphaerales bacterium]
MPNIEQEEYNRRWASEHYGALHAGYWKFFLRFIDREIPVDATASRSILDVGCGAGHISRYFAEEKKLKITGIDLSDVGVAQCAQAVPTGKFRVHDLTQPMPFDAGSFDYIWCSEVLEHLFSPLYALQQMKRVLKPNGKILLTVPYHDRLKNVGIALFAFERHYSPTYPHIQYFTRRSLTDLVQQAGLRVNWIGHCGMGKPLRDWIVPTNHLLVAEQGGE